MFNRNQLKGWLLLFAVLFAFSGCKDDDERPSNHTIDKGGRFHAPGLFEPMANCTGCHGSNLTGGGEAPSCLSCHGQKW